ncbi:efflux RND transporter permease subunit [Paraburkholderia phenazinium]
MALLITRSELSVPAMIGLVMLMGIVTKNSILLVEYTMVGVRDRSPAAWLQPCASHVRLAQAQSDAFRRI